MRTIAERVDQLGVVFPFEAELYNNGRPLAEFVGHPLLDVVRPTRPAGRDARSATASTPTRPVLALLPGSRKKEVRYLLPPDVRCRGAARGAKAGSRSSRCAESLDADDLAAALGGAVTVSDRARRHV